ncbi:putative bifunctional diguanylate cyclase/phosphodiesterase [Qipengyuania sediminis]|uniref:putative bifunctional diguanylate cyclase/phosphodiesterase n=1 Tax=Qipengyuania sediminis TaxID=1532023 RepID=UPI001F10EB1F|nr:EAL domain-containing protein [Qipengyuania sediminis]
MSANPDMTRLLTGSAPASRQELSFDGVTLGIAAAAILLFLATGGTVLPDLVRSWRGLGGAPDAILANALILNIAVILFGWSRYKALSQELAARRRSEEQALKLADTDPLTGAKNRRSFLPAVNSLALAAEKAGLEVAVGLIDLDHFKNINDYHGHQIGDAVLLEVAARFSAILPPGALLARLGGDEFAFALSYPADTHAGVEAMADRLVAAAARPIAAEETMLEISASIGIASSRDGDPGGNMAGTGEQLMHRADIAMYQAKKQGRNRLQWFEAAMEYEQRFRGELEAGIRRGLRADEFVPFYEQQVDLDTGEIIGFEMLARWRSPDLGIVSPDIFIPIVEELGLIEELSTSLMAKAFEDARAWHPRLTLAVNVSPVQLRDPWFAQKTLKLLVAHAFPPSRLEIEITETALHDNPGLVRNTLTGLRNQGVKVTLDDFGMGYSSLSQLRLLPFDRLKIDRSFIRDIKHDETNTKLVNAIISMGAGLELPLVAEGIENDAILATLREMGQLKGQGYHYGRPEPAEQVVERLAALNLLAPPVPAAPAFGPAGPPAEAVSQKTG